VASLPHRDDELEAFEDEQDRGVPWIYPRDPAEPMADDMPNPLVVRANGLTTGVVKGEEVTFLNGVDTAGKKWSRLLGAKALKDVLIDGVQSEWDDDRQAFVETGRIGPVQPGELVSILFKGWREVASGINKGKLYPDLKVQRRSGSAPKPEATDEPEGGAADDDIPW
jgi:hypothetical protein